ncbi:DnaA ATPase domain-containing protein [Gemmatimonas sp.]|uniref:DnaA ATPase domain-containing protein n=1 Tax=Gemmatimonas sp. TaxID=1962908 RepID=UPI003DA6991C
MADAPGQAYNPLFIYGGSGLGKTHLVAAIAHRARETQPALRVRFSTGEEVAQQLHLAIASGQPQQFLEEFGAVDLLILDDVQFLTGQKETQSELLRLLNVLLARGQQLVLTSDRQPSEIPDVDQRLLSRLSGGLDRRCGRARFRNAARHSAQCGR